MFITFSQLKEFQSRQKPEVVQNAFNESSSEETPQNVLNNSFTNTLYQGQENVPYQNNNDASLVPNPGHSDFSTFFNNSVTPGSQQNMFETLGDQLAQQHYSEPISQPQYHTNPLSTTYQEDTNPMPAAQSIGDMNSNEFFNSPPPQVQDVSEQITDELQMVTIKLNAEIAKNNELMNQVSNQNGIIDELQLELHKLKLENSAKGNIDVASLQGQLGAHAQTIGILVGEKAELTAAVAKYQSLAQSNASEVEELQGRLNASRHRVSVLERDIGNMKSSHEKYDTTQQKLCDELEQCQEEMKKFKKINLDAEEEIAELKRSSALKSERIVMFEQELKKKNSELELSRLRVEQLSVGDVIQTDGQLETLSTEKLFYEQKTHELEGVIQQLNAEKEQSSQQYQNYVQQLNQEISKLAQQLQEYVAENDRLSKREEGLIKHVGDLERQMQQQFNKQKKMNEVGVTSEELNALKSKCDVLEAEKAQLEVSFTLRNSLKLASDRFMCESFKMQSKYYVSNGGSFIHALFVCDL